MNKEKYDKLITQYAIKCIKEYPEDPFQLTMEYANGILTDNWEELEHLTYSKTSNWSLSEMSGISDDPQTDLRFHETVDNVDTDLCKRIRELQVTPETARTSIEQGGSMEFMDGTTTDDYSEWLELSGRNQLGDLIK